MIVEALLAHVIGSFYFRSDKSNYNWGIVFTYFVIQTLVDSNNYLEWLVFSLGLVVWNNLYNTTIKKNIRLFLNTIQFNPHHPLNEIYSTNKISFLFLVDHILSILWLLILQSAINGLTHTMHIVLSVIFLLIIVYKLVRNFSDYRWKTILQEGAALMILASLTIIVSQLFMNALDIYRPFTLPPHVFAVQSAYFIWVRGVFILVLLMRPTNQIIRTLSSKYDPKNIQKASIEEYELKSKDYKQEAGFKGAGAMIGNLERLLMLLSFFFGSLVSVVAILSIKAFARYKMIAEDPYFSEYFVIGTMLSVLITLGCYVLFLLMIV